MARLHSETIPTSTLAATARVVDGFVTTQSDHSGISSSFTRAYTATGITQTATDGRGNTTTGHTDLAGRSISSTDAAGNTTTTVYDAAFDAPSVITNAQGKTSCYKYDLRGRKVAEWGTAIQSPRRLVGGLDKCAAFAPKGRGRNGVRPSQPALFGYDDADNLTALTTFRADSGDITTDPTERTDGDTTTWAYHPTAGVELSKTYADNSQVVKTYDAFNRLATETNARGIVKTLSYDASTGLLTGISFSDEATPSQSFAYNILGRLTQVTDAAGTRTIAYNEYSEQQSDSLDSGAHTHLVTELRDSYGRSTGFTYARSGSTQFTTSVGYATDGRIATAGFMHGGVNRQFSYSYLSGSNLLHTLTQPNGLTLTQSYEEHRDLLTDMQYHRGSTLVGERSYSGDKAPDGCKGDWTNAQRLPEGRGAVRRLRVTLGRPTQPVATRPLGIRKDGTWYTYGWDLTKKAPDGRKGDWTNAQHLPEGRGAVRRLRVNICEVFGSDGYIKTAYTYTPYGAVTATGNVTQPIQWSSEYNDTELGLVYYNYRHYNPADGRWTGRDFLTSRALLGVYDFGDPAHSNDFLGLDIYSNTTTEVELTIADPFFASSYNPHQSIDVTRPNPTSPEQYAYGLYWGSSYRMHRYAWFNGNLKIQKSYQAGTCKDIHTFPISIIFGVPAESDMLSSTSYKNISKRLGLNYDLFEGIFGVEGKYDKFSLTANLNPETGNISGSYTMPLGGFSGKMDWHIKGHCNGVNNISLEMECEEWTGKVGLKRQKNSVFEASLMRRMQPYAFTVSASSSGSFSLMLESNPDKDVSMFLKISLNLRGENAITWGAHFEW